MKQTMQATVNPRLLHKANRLFTGTLAGRVTEILQNARRAGATNVDITNKNGFVHVHDNGKGIEDFSRLLDMGGSGWNEQLSSSEDPAGIGLFCLAPREVAVRSNGKQVVIHEAGWTGQPVHIVVGTDRSRHTDGFTGRQSGRHRLLAVPRTESPTTRGWIETQCRSSSKASRRNAIHKSCRALIATQSGHGYRSMCLNQ